MNRQKMIDELKASIDYLAENRDQVDSGHLYSQLNLLELTVNSIKNSIKSIKEDIKCSKCNKINH